MMGESESDEEREREETSKKGISSGKGRSMDYARMMMAEWELATDDKQWREWSTGESHLEHTQIQLDRAVQRWIPN